MSDEPQFERSTEMNDDLLPFVVELWKEDGSGIELVLARVQTASLGQAVFNASSADLLARRVTLRRGAKIIADTDTAGGGAYS